MKRLLSISPSISLPFLLIAGAHAAEPPEVVAHKSGAEFIGKIDSVSGSLLEKMRATSWHAGCPVSPEDLRQLTLSYWNFEEKPATGILIVNREVAQEVVQIFHDLFNHGFLIEKMFPVEEYNANDDASMAANNTSAFNCRDVTGQPGKFSNHSWGRAIDINPLTNPYIKGEKVLPPEGRRYVDRTQAFPGSILEDSFIVKRFAESGWQWGGSWSSPKDYQHFEKPVSH
jgi:hypothetical protein